MTPPITEARDAVAASFDESWGRLVAGLIGWCGDWDLAEECAAEAYAEAVPAWERSGVPDSPLAWLTTVARNRARDRMRRRTTEAAKLDLLSNGPTPTPPRRSRRSATRTSPTSGCG